MTVPSTLVSSIRVDSKKINIGLNRRSMFNSYSQDLEIVLGVGNRNLVASGKVAPLFLLDNYLLDDLRWTNRFFHLPLVLQKIRFLYPSSRPLV